MRPGKRPKVVAITNEGPDWSPLDVQYGDESWHLLLKSFEQEDIEYEAFKFYDDLSVLERFDPCEWLVWNWGEEWAGEPWSDAEVIEEIERRGFAYTGSPAEPMRLAQNRMGVKNHLRAAGLPTLPARVFHDPADVVAWDTFPAIVKGANQHASVGLDGDSVVHTHDQLARRVVHLRQHCDDDALVEPFLDSREFQVAVWGNDRPEALPPSEIVYSGFTEMRDRLHTQAWKVDRESRGYREIRMPCPAPLDRPDWRERLESIAVDAYKAVGLRDYGRFDLRMLGDEPQILDVNANPELDPESVVLAGAKARGMGYEQLVGRIIDFAAGRMPLA